MAWAGLTGHSLQLQGELQAKKDAVRLYRGVFHGVGVIYKNEGVSGLLRVINCAVRKASF
jgi:solute carrier family 25 protein 34/35